ncbi:MAG: AMP-binding protein [Burkholderiaceae bacterium]|nr:AMP-binding protein [Burkholderiaceae bacterium]
MLPEMIAACGRNFPDKTAFIQGTRSATWRQMDQRSSRLAGALRALGVAREETVAILSQERIEVYEHWFACIKAGAVRVGINWRYSPREMMHILTDCRPRLLFVDAHCAASVEPLRQTLEEIGCVVVGFGQGHGFALDHETLITQAQEGFESVCYQGDEVVLCTYTSGTTGAPKGVILKESGVAAAIVHTVVSVGVGPEDVWFRPNQSSWVVLVGNSAGLANGMTMVIPDGVFDLMAFLRDIERVKVTVALLVPTSVRRMLDEIKTGRHDISTLRRFVYGGGPIAPALVRETLQTLDCELVQTYGLTEATWATYLSHGDHLRGLKDRPELLQSAGRFALHFEGSIRDDEGRPLPPGEIGTLWLRSPCIMKGYLHLPEATRAVLQPGGWLITHDIGYIDAEGYLFLKDRKNFLIITGGVNVYASAVEAVLSENVAVREVAVVGLPHEEWGEAVTAVVVRAEGVSESTLDAAALIASCQGRLSKMETPKRIVFVDELPRNFTGKVDKLRIRKELLAVSADAAGA